MHWHRERRQGNPDVIGRPGTKDGDQYWNPGGQAKSARHFKLKSYGLTEADFGAMLEAQGGGCAICGSTDPGNGSFRIDHDHISNRVRGLLCHKCNVALGLMGDDPDRLEAGAAYLRR